jgi:hypothetical protein
MCTGGHFLGGKARPGRGADHSLPSTAEVKNEKELYLLSPPGAFMACSEIANTLKKNNMDRIRKTEIATLRI